MGDVCATSGGLTVEHEDYPRRFYRLLYRRTASGFNVKYLELVLSARKITLLDAISPTPYREGLRMFTVRVGVVSGSVYGVFDTVHQAERCIQRSIICLKK